MKSFPSGLREEVGRRFEALKRSTLNTKFEVVIVSKGTYEYEAATQGTLPKA